TSEDVAVELNTSRPVDNRWEVRLNNATDADVAFTAYTVCAPLVSGEATAASGPVANAAGAQTLATASCPSGAVPLGGGVGSSSSSTAVNVNAVYPVDGGWAAYQNNASADDADLDVTVVCSSP